MNHYIVKPEDIVSKQIHPDGTLHLYTTTKNGKPTKGWSRKKYYPMLPCDKRKKTHPKNLADNES